MIRDMVPQPFDQQGSTIPNLAKAGLQFELGCRIPLENCLKLFIVHREHLLHDGLDVRHERFSLRARRVGEDRGVFRQGTYNTKSKFDETIGARDSSRNFPCLVLSHSFRSYSRPPSRRTSLAAGDVLIATRCVGRIDRACNAIGNFIGRAR